MITVPTGELVGLLADTIPFAEPEDDLPGWHAIRLEWDRRMLHAMAADALPVRAVISSWHPDDHPGGEVQDDLLTTWGGADEPWSVLLPLPAAGHVVKAFKLPVKQQRIPLTVDVQQGAVTVKRSRATRLPEQTVRVEGLLEDAPDVRKILADVPAIQPVTGLAFNASYLADFHKVRQRGALDLTFTGTTTAVLIQLGERFSGVLMPTRIGDPRERGKAT